MEQAFQGLRGPGGLEMRTLEMTPGCGCRRPPELGTCLLLEGGGPLLPQVSAAPDRGPSSDTGLSQMQGGAPRLGPARGGHSHLE